MRVPRGLLAAKCAALLALAVPSIVSAGYVPVYGAPAFDRGTGNGYLGANIHMNPGDGVSAGPAVGYTEKYVNGSSHGSRGLRWDAAGVGTELGTLGTSSSGWTDSHAYAVNTAGVAVGYSAKYIVGDSHFGKRAVRWDASGTSATELGNLGIPSDGYTNSIAYAVNSASTAVGYSEKYAGDNWLGERAVRWDAAGTSATELGHLGTDSNGFTVAQAYAVNSAGTAAGYSSKYVGGSYVGAPAVRWNASGVASELGNLGTNGSGQTFALAYAINASGTAVGYAPKWVGDNHVGERAVRWDASGTAATELDNLGSGNGGSTYSEAVALNSAGIAVGHASKYVQGILVGDRAVRWDASGMAATELGNLGTNDNGGTNARARDVNTAGIAVGYSEKWVGGTYVGNRAVLWGDNGVAIDLNTLIDPASGWTLTSARAIGDANFVVGVGMFDPDGPGGFQEYTRLFQMDISSAIPEPGSFALLCPAAAALFRRRLHRA